MKRTILTLIGCLALSGSSLGRKWSNTDGSKSFEADLISCDGTNVTVKRGVRQMTFKLNILSEEDQKWAIAEGKKLAQREANKEALGDFKESEFGKAISKLSKLDEGSFQDFEMEAAPEFFILYFSASW